MISPGPSGGDYRGVSPQEHPMIATLSVATGVVRSRIIWSVVAILLLMWEPGRTTQNTASTLPGRSRPPDEDRQGHARSAPAPPEG